MKYKVQDIIDFYESGNNTTKTAKHFKMDFYTLKNIFQANGVATRKATKDLYKLDETFFNIIDTEEKAY